MRRGELYRAEPPGGDPRRFRIYLLVSRQALIDSRYSTVIGVPVYSAAANVPTEVPIGPASGLKTASYLRCDDVRSVPRTAIRQYVGLAGPETMARVGEALRIALELDYEPAE